MTDAPCHHKIHHQNVFLLLLLLLPLAIPRRDTRRVVIPFDGRLGRMEVDMDNHPVHNPNNPSRTLGGLTFASPDDLPPDSLTPAIASILGFVEITRPQKVQWEWDLDIACLNDQDPFMSNDKVMAILRTIQPDLDKSGRPVYPAHLFA